MAIRLRGRLLRPGSAELLQLVDGVMYRGWEGMAAPRALNNRPFRAWSRGQRLLVRDSGMKGVGHSRT
eukprot:4343738-Alexandrium_andersonii.AAC.1